MKKISGFSLIELVVVIVLIGILASVAMPRMFQSIGSAHDAAFQAFGSNFASSLNSYRSDYLLNAAGQNRYENLAVITTLGVPDPNTGCLLIGQKMSGMMATDFIADTAIPTTADTSSYTYMVSSGVVDGKTSCAYVYIKNIEKKRTLVYAPIETDANILNSVIVINDVSTPDTTSENGSTSTQSASSPSSTTGPAATQASTTTSGTTTSSAGTSSGTTTSTGTASSGTTTSPAQTTSGTSSASTSDAYHHDCRQYWIKVITKFFITFRR